MNDFKDNTKLLLNLDILKERKINFKTKELFIRKKDIYLLHLLNKKAKIEKNLKTQKEEQKKSQPNYSTIFIEHYNKNRSNNKYLQKQNEANNDDITKITTIIKSNKIFNREIKFEKQNKDNNFYLNQSSTGNHKKIKIKSRVYNNSKDTNFETSKFNYIETVPNLRNNNFNREFLKNKELKFFINNFTKTNYNIYYGKNLVVLEGNNFKHKKKKISMSKEKNEKTHKEKREKNICLTENNKNINCAINNHFNERNQIIFDLNKKINNNIILKEKRIKSTKENRINTRRNLYNKFNLDLSRYFNNKKNTLNKRIFSSNISKKERYIQPEISSVFLSSKKSYSIDEKINNNKSKTRYGKTFELIQGLNEKKEKSIRDTHFSYKKKNIEKILKDIKSIHNNKTNNEVKSFLKGIPNVVKRYYGIIEDNE